MVNKIAIANELVDSTDYVNKINSGVNNKADLNQSYPTGTIFNYETGDYQ
jgi:hypothetical protein